MGISDIVTLASGKKYLILDEIEVDNKMYFLVTGLKEDEQTINSDFQIFLKKEKPNGKAALAKIPDNQFKADLLNLFMMKTVTDDIDTNMEQ